MSLSTKTWLVIITLAVVLFGALPAVVGFYVDWLWFGEVGYRSVFWNVVGTRWAMGLVFALITFLIVAGNGLLARRVAPVPRLPQQGDLASQFTHLFNRYVSRYYALSILVVAGFIALLAGKALASYWHNWLLFTHPVAFGSRDPIFGNDLSLYVFRLPMLQTLWQWLYITLIASFLLAAVVHYLGGALRFPGGVPSFAPYVKGHLSVLLALILFAKAAGYQLSAYNLLYSPRGVAFGASYADVHALLPVLGVLMVLAVVGGAATLINIFRRGLWVPALGVALLVVVSLVGGTLYPALVTRFQVAPNEMAMEQPYIQNGISFTNQAYGLDRIEERDFPDIQPLTAADVAENPKTMGNIRMWDYRPLRKSYKQLQELRPYYVFPEVDIDRYRLGSQYRQLMLAARELSASNLPSQSWQNRHLLYTHGYGVVASPVNEVTEEGAPHFILQNIPPAAAYPELRLERPEIYYGESDLDFSLVGTTQQEVNYATTDETTYTAYRGKGGISMRSLWARTAMAMHLGSVNIMITNVVTPRTRILIRRHISQRLATLAPFLLLDHDPYIVVADGRLRWMQDAYTVTSAYPYSQPARDGNATYNYIRNSVKVVTDAYDGTITLYVADPRDPLVRSYQQIFPGLFRPLSDMPASLMGHLRYPERMFRVQAELLTKYHMREPSQFYSSEDQWVLANELPGKGGEEAVDQSGRMEPYYVIMRLPREPRESFILMIPYTPKGRPNMIAWLAGRCDQPDYGKMLVYKFPKSELVYGPIQIEARIDQSPDISRDLTLWRGRGSEVIRGNLLVLPVNSSVLYVEPIFLRSEESDIPELKRIVLASGTRVVMQPTLEQALSALLGMPVVAPTAATPAAPRPTGAAPPAPVPGSQALVNQAREQYLRAQERLRNGDWAGYGEAMKELGGTLERLAGQRR